MHEDITKFFKRYNLFGFTGTPIFAENARSGSKQHLRTTEEAFGDRLHTYTIVDAINDKNVLPFRIDFVNTIKASPGIKDKKVPAIDTEKALISPRRVEQVVAYIREHFEQRPSAASTRSSPPRPSGAAKLLRRVQEAGRTPEERGSRSASSNFAANEESPDGLLGEEEFETAALDKSSRDFLDDAIRDYNTLFKSNFDTADNFQNYYKDLSERLKKKEVDIVIVVNMFLTGFDATTLNTLWVDKNLRAHGLIQAYSRTNRILNSVKTYGNIVTFRDLDQATNDALALFGNKDAKGIALLKPYADYHAQYAKLVAKLAQGFPIGQEIAGETAKKEFVRLFGQILRVRNILTAFDDFASDTTLSERDLQDYQSRYLNIHADLRGTAQADKEPINDDLVFELELVKQVEVNVDYILLLVEKYLKAKGADAKAEIRAGIVRSVDASPSLRDKKDLIEQFVDSISAGRGQGLDRRRREGRGLSRIIAERVGPRKRNPSSRTLSTTRHPEDGRSYHENPASRLPLLA